MIKTLYYNIKNRWIKNAWMREDQWKKTHGKEFFLIENEQWLEIKNTYEYYITHISSESMAISKEASLFLYSFLLNKKDIKILDFGSGFSSYLFRIIQHDVVSVDDDLLWLEKTKSFLMDKGLSPDNVLLVSDSIWKKKKYDFIFVDLNYVDERIKYIDLILNLTHKNSIILFDDVHKPEYLKELGEKLNKKKGFLLDHLTIDSYGRFSMIYYL
ncbi:MAG: hypothetical protein AB1304_04850 [Bacteroidota bacterium]